MSFLQGRWDEEASLSHLSSVRQCKTVNCTASGIGVLPPPAPPHSEVREKESLSLEYWTPGLGWNAIPIQKRCFLTSLQIACWPLTSHHHVFIFIRVLVPNGYFLIYLSGGRGFFCFVCLLSLFLPTLNSVKSALWKSNFICLVQCHIPSTQHNRILAGTHQMFVK